MFKEKTVCHYEGTSGVFGRNTQVHTNKFIRALRTHFIYLDNYSSSYPALPNRLHYVTEIADSI